MYVDTQLINRRLHEQINDIINTQPQIMIDGKTMAPACLFTLAYKLQCRAKSSDWLLQQLQDDESAVIQVLPTMKPLRLLIQVRLNGVNSASTLLHYTAKIM